MSEPSGVFVVAVFCVLSLIYNIILTYILKKLDDILKYIKKE